MATNREQIEHLEHVINEDDSLGAKKWKDYSHSRKYLKRQMSKFMRRANKKISLDDIGGKTNRRPFRGWEY